MKSNIKMWLLVHGFLFLFFLCIYIGVGPEIRPMFLRECINGLPILGILEFMVIGFFYFMEKID